MNKIDETRRRSIRWGMQSKILLGAAEIKARVGEMGAEISRWAKSLENPPCMLWLAEGAIVFAADLMRGIDAQMEVKSLRVSSYGNDTKSSSAPKYDCDFSEFSNRDILLVDDIFDTGKTIKTVACELEHAGAKSVRTCVLLRRSGSGTACAPDYAGFEIPEGFVFGYGLDIRGQKRNLPDINVLIPEQKEKTQCT